MRRPDAFLTAAVSEPEQEPVENTKDNAFLGKDNTFLLQPGRYRRGSQKLIASKTVPAATSNVGDALLLWIDDLQTEYGIKLILLLHSSQHLLKGIVHQCQAAAVMWLFREYQISGPQMQVYVSIAASAWALKPVLGCASDMIPLWGYRRAPYVLITSIVGVACTTSIGFSTKESVKPLSVVACLFGMALQGATCDLLTEARYSEQLQEKPRHGPDLISYVWAGISIGGMIAMSIAGWIISNIGARAVFLACIAPSAAVILPTCLNFFEEVPLSREMTSTLRHNFSQQTEVVALCALMSGLSMSLSTVGAISESHLTQCVAALVVISIMLPSFHLILRPEIAKVNTFFVLQACFNVTISGATFYFYTDQPAQYPGGPHFSTQFFASVLGFVASAMSLTGLALYTKYMKDWGFRSLLLFSNIIVTLLSLLDTFMFLRLNQKFGIPDTAFVLGSSACTVVMKQLQWMPGVLLMSQLCPVGMEATMFALLAGCANVGSQISDYLGAFLLDSLKVQPTGAVGEAHEFDNLWKASLIGTLLPGLTILLIPFMIPVAQQTDNKLLVGRVASATWGSPLWRWRQRQK
eukprot:TRINITY_DN28550_c0_g1_i1.p1 TRINITY_DN28550_c0_g1~~TRINITY_DN28550_c0_g1_i1.p1  ORF type:complete len:580 (-),score=88.73 TRINITY_DN28550_c0_g1_i1:124-1863(-)